MNFILHRPISFYFAIACCSFSCGTGQDNNINRTNIATKLVDTSSNLHDNSRNINLNDTIGRLLTVALSKDTFEYEAFYNDNSPYELLYVKTGNLFTSKVTNAITLQSTSDTTVLCELFYLDSDKWIKTGTPLSLYISGFSPAYFNILFDDFNFDGFKDTKIVFYQSNGMVYSYGYILTFNKLNSSLTLHPETIEIPDLEIDTKGRTLISTEYSNPNSDIEDFKVISKFDWTNGTLKLISKKKHKLKRGQP